MTIKIFDINPTLKKTLSLLIGIIIFSIFLYFSDLKILSNIEHINLIPLFGVIITSFACTAGIAIRWGLLTNSFAQKKVAAWSEYFHCFIITRVLGFILPKDVTDIAGRSAWISKYYKIPISVSSSSVVIDRIFDVLTTVLLLIAVLPFWLNWVSFTTEIFIVSSLAIIGGILLHTCQYRLIRLFSIIFNSICKLINRIPIVKTNTQGFDIIQNIDKYVFLKAYSLTLLKFANTALRLIFLVQLLEIPIHYKILILGVPLGQMSFMLAFTPGGLGVFESGWYGILILAGVNKNISASFVVGQRIIMILSNLFLAMISYFIIIVKSFFPIKTLKSVI